MLPKVRIVSVAVPICALCLSLFASVRLLEAQAAKELKMIVGRSAVVDYPSDVARIATSNPEIIDYVAVTSREILLHAKSHGSATLIVWSRTGEREFYNVTVDHNLQPIKEILQANFPSEAIEVESARDIVSLRGTVSSQTVIDRAIAIVTPLAKAVINNLRLPPLQVEKQIVLRVKFAELNRNAAESFGVNLISTGAGNTIGRIAPGGTTAPNPSEIGNGKAVFTISDALNIFAFRPDLNIGAFVKALQTRGVLQILAEPNLVTTNGKEASFLVGGEFPIPVLQGGAASGAITIQFREFGIRLTFKPEITGNKTIKVYAKPEVNTIDSANGVTVSGFYIPALATRRIETNIELGEGQSFVIGGLIDDRLTESVNRLPGLSSIPLLGALFRSRAENKSKSELIVLVTPEIAEPLSAGDPKPQIEFPKDFLQVLPPAKPKANGTKQEQPNKVQNGRQDATK